MILPIVAYGNQVLKRKAGNIDKEYPELDVLIKNMSEGIAGLRCDSFHYFLVKPDQISARS